MNNKRDKDTNMVQFTLDPRKPTVLSAEQKARLNRLAARPESEIDLSDIPELTDEQLSRMVRASGKYKPTKTPTSIRLDSDVLDWLRKGGSGWQTWLNTLLRAIMTGQAGASGLLEIQKMVDLLERQNLEKSKTDESSGDFPRLRSS